MYKALEGREMLSDADIFGTEVGSFYKYARFDRTYKHQPDPGR